MEQQAETRQISEQIKQSMQVADISAAELSRRSGVSVASLSRILSGQVSPSFQNVARIAGALNVSLDTFLSHTHQPLPTVEKPLGAEVPLHTEIRVAYHIALAGRSPQEVARLLEKAARGNWVSSWTEHLVATGHSKARVAEIHEEQHGRVRVDMHFPHVLVEDGSLAGLLSVIGAAVTSTGARVLDVAVPTALVRTYNGPTFGMRGLRDATSKFGRPLLASTMRPMHGLAPRQYGRAIFEALRGGVDISCDPTMLHSIPGNPWRERFRFAAEAAHTASNDTNEIKLHAANISAATVEEMIERAEWAKELELSAVMLDTAACGWSSVQSVARWCRDNAMLLAAMGGRALYSEVLSEPVQAQLLRLAGCDIISIGSPLRGDAVNRRRTMGVIRALRDDTFTQNTEHGLLFDQAPTALDRVCPALGGGHNPWHFARLIDALGDDCILQCGGSVMGHPWGSAAGATSNRVAVEALIQARGEGHNLNVDGRAILQKAMRYSPELKTALDFWQEGAFLFGVISGDKKLEAKVEDAEQPLSQRPTLLHAVTPNEEDTDQ